MTTLRKNILIVEDESSIADTLVYAFEKEGMSPFRVATLADAREMLAKKLFSAIVLDVGLPDGNGFEFCRELRKTHDVPVVFLTARNDEIDRVVGLEIGADDYVTKPFSPREVVARLNAIFRRVDSAPTIKNSGQSFQLNKAKRKITYKGKSLELSRYEYGILVLLLARPGQVYSREQIMEQVWENPDMSLLRTVDTHIKTLRSKLAAVDPSEDVLITHRGVGYSLKDET